MLPRATRGCYGSAVALQEYQLFFIHTYRADLNCTVLVWVFFSLHMVRSSRVPAGSQQGPQQGPSRVPSRVQAALVDVSPGQFGSVWSYMWESNIRVTHKPGKDLLHHLPARVLKGKQIQETSDLTKKNSFIYLSCFKMYIYYI